MRGVQPGKTDLICPINSTENRPEEDAREMPCVHGSDGYGRFSDGALQEKPELLRQGR